ncbi:hypothetical protein AAG570_004424 [Ranatra chinensis]|uniref:Uncharacterized protein n=1 Tax=Ranatra chinensis TaxID=642074 RepID=A0ABD0Y0V8_9HEMI
MASKRRNMFYQNKKQETTEIVRRLIESFGEHTSGPIGRHRRRLTEGENLYTGQHKETWCPTLSGHLSPDFLLSPDLVAPHLLLLLRSLHVGDPGSLSKCRWGAAGGPSRPRGAETTR